MKCFDLRFDLLGWRSGVIAELIDRDGSVCEFCGGALGNESIDIDHIKPKDFGGRDVLSNLRVLHRACHKIRHSEKDKWREDYARLFYG